MGRYTNYGNSVDAQVQAQLDLATKIILRIIPGVRSIILAGGFGRGEGSVEIQENGKIVFLRDFDLVAIVDRIPTGRIQHSLRNEIYRSLNLRDPGTFRFSDFAVSVYFRRTTDLIYPDIWFYDLKAASQLLYGEDVRNLIPWSKNNIPLSSGLRILFEKVCGLLGVFPSGKGASTGKIEKQQERWLIIECYKTFIEICTVLCILAGRYEPKYSTRARNLGIFYADKFPDLAQALPDLPKTVADCTNFKLKPNFAKVQEDPIQLWFRTRDSLGVVLSLYLKRYLESAHDEVFSMDWKNSSQQMKMVARNYYKPFLGPLIRTKVRFSNRVLLDVASFLYQGLTNAEYSYIVTRSFGKPYLHPLRRWYVSPSLKFFPAGFIILFSLTRNGTIEKDLLERAAKELRNCIPVELPKFDMAGWESLRRHFLKAYSLCEGYHLAK
jgi:hypothetical protein